MRYDRGVIQEKLKQSPLWRRRALAMLYELQSIAEREAKETLHSNAVGFTGPDARVLSGYAEWAAKGRSFSRGMDLLLQRRLPKYWRQVVEAIAKSQASRLVKAGKSFVEISEREITNAKV